MLAIAGGALDHAVLTEDLQRSSDAVVRAPKPGMKKARHSQKMPAAGRSAAQKPPSKAQRPPKPAARNPGEKKPDVTKRKAQSKRDSGSSSESDSGCDGESSVSSVTESEDEAAEGPEPTVSGKRIRKAVQHFDPVRDGANDTKRRKESK